MLLAASVSEMLPEPVPLAVSTVSQVASLVAVQAQVSPVFNCAVALACVAVASTSLAWKSKRINDRRRAAEAIEVGFGLAGNGGGGIG